MQFLWEDTTPDYVDLRYLHDVEMPESSPQAFLSLDLCYQPFL